MNVMIEMRNITKTFPGVIALDHVSLKVEEGTVHAICGENGAGKSTLMGVLSGVHPHGSYSGGIFFRDQPVAFRNIRASERAGIVIIHQELALVPELSIAENLFLGHEKTRWGIVNWKQARIRARELMCNVGLHEHPDTVIKHLGVGKQQLVEIAKALGKDVKLLILDEPTAALNETDSEHLLGILRGLRHKGITCIIISHKLNEIRAIADAVTILRDGLSVETLRMDQDVDEDRIIRGMVGRPLGARYPARPPACTGEIFFEVRDWTVRHPQVPDRLLCKKINFHVRRGEVVGFAGLMGAGRTELARSLFGRSYGIYESGKIIKNGRELRLHTVAEAIHAGIAYVPEERKTQGLNLLDSVKATIVSANLRGIAHGFVLNRDREFSVSEEYRRSLKIKTHGVSAGVATLSGGNQQKVVLSKWLFTGPDLLILDEPTRGIDVGAKYEIYEMIQELAATGRGVMVISSELPEVLGLSDRIYAIFEGSVTGVLDRAEASPERLMKLMTAVCKQQVEEM